MNRTEKQAAVAELGQALGQAPHVILASFQGLTVNQATELRGKVRQAGGRFKVIKNRLARRAAEGAPAGLLAPQFTGPCALVTHPTDAAGLAKVLAAFGKDNPQLVLRAGVVDARQLLAGEDVKRLATLPGLQELRATLLQLLQTPATSLVRLLGTPGTRVAQVLESRGKQLAEGA